MGFFKKRKKLHAKQKSTTVSLTPLIDTALTLLIIFMITSPMINNAIKVNMPKGKTKEDAHSTPELVIHIDQANTLFFNGKQMNKNDLIQAISQTENKQGVIYIQADQAVSYGMVINIVDQIKVAIVSDKLPGITSVALATQKEA